MKSRHRYSKRFKVSNSEGKVLVIYAETAEKAIFEASKKFKENRSSITTRYTRVYWKAHNKLNKKETTFK